MWWFITTCHISYILPSLHLLYLQEIKPNSGSQCRDIRFAYRKPLKLRACWHLWFICLWLWILCHLLSGVHITISFCLCACNHSTSHMSSAMHSMIYMNGSDSIRVWAAKRRRVWMCSEAVKPGAQRSSTLARDLGHVETSLFHYMYVRSGFYFL